MAKKKFQVLRQHYGDKQYWAGEERELEEGDAKALVEAGTLKAKAEKKVENKAEKKLANKAAK